MMKIHIDTRTGDLELDQDIDRFIKFYAPRFEEYLSPEDSVSELIFAVLHNAVCDAGRGDHFESYLKGYIESMSERIMDN